MEKKLKESNKCIAVSEGSKSITRNYKFVPVPYGSKEVTNLREKIKLLVVQIKLKETSLEASANSFSEKERNLQNKIEELEGRVEKLDQNCTSFCCNQPRKSSEDNIGITPNVYIAEDLRSRDEKPRSSTSGMSEENGNLKLSINSNHSSVSEYEPKTCSINNTDHNANEAG
ncbi:MYOSIN HEAVY CHAIN-LIKE PROTEIN [Salix koriyanagi]|uniref:MYOSIN HEAVY CHAIN-LIKE PROTEIN n=1 Tax=Salix koriyanagi TaxID=2511006 RepID=A0A9Q0Q824_9ROSI|nr:MYOSIN HEAVY CHAIN-LIKE PROTEIN [Salix koriyanagi]